jgi:hypothetical protein
MTVIEDTLATLSTALPRQACPSELGIGDIARFRDVALPVIITGSELEGDVPDLYRVFTWISQARTSNGEPVMVGQSVPERGEMVVLEARAEIVRADEVRDGDLLLLEDRTSLWGVASGEPYLNQRGIYDVAWRAGCLPSGLPQTIGWLQRDPHQTVRRAARTATSHALKARTA